MKRETQGIARIFASPQELFAVQACLLVGCSAVMVLIAFFGDYENRIMLLGGIPIAYAGILGIVLGAKQRNKAEIIVGLIVGLFTSLGNVFALVVVICWTVVYFLLWTLTWIIQLNLPIVDFSSIQFPSLLVLPVILLCTLLAVGIQWVVSQMYFLKVPAQLKTALPYVLVSVLPPLLLIIPTQVTQVMGMVACGLVMACCAVICPVVALDDSFTSAGTRVAEPS